MSDTNPLAPLEALHHPIPIYPSDCQVDEDWDEHESDPAEGFCRDCPPEFHACETCRDEDGSWIEWPCQNADALAEARQAVDALVSERDAYRRAKQENDERFMLERGEVRAERDAAREALARVEALQVHWETALGLNSCPACGHIPEMDCDHGEGYHHALSDIRAVLVQPATYEEAGQ